MGEETVVEQAVDVAYSVAVVVGAAVVAVVVNWLAGRLVLRVNRLDAFAQEARARCRWPSRVTAALLGALTAVPATELSQATTARLVHGLLVAAIVAGTWLLLRLALAVETVLLGRYATSGEQPDDARRRGRQTQVILIRRLVSGLMVAVATGAVLLTFEGARSVGTSLLASAGILAVVTGVAAQSTLANVVAGLQLAVAEPLSLDDVVFVEGEWGNIEEVTLTYVVVRTWDRRRLMLPTSYFTSTPFENWSRTNYQIIQSVYWRLDPRTPVQALREEFHRQVEAHPMWDGDIATLLVVDADAETIRVRGLATAADSLKAWDLGCALREGILAWVVAEHPEALPARRLLEAAPDVDRLHGRAETAGGGYVSPGPETMPNPDPARTGEFPTVQG